MYLQILPSTRIRIVPTELVWLPAEVLETTYTCLRHVIHTLVLANLLHSPAVPQSDRYGYCSSKHSPFELCIDGGHAYLAVASAYNDVSAATLLSHESVVNDVRVHSCRDLDTAAPCSEASSPGSDGRPDREDFLIASGRPSEGNVQCCGTGASTGMPELSDVTNASPRPLSPLAQPGKQPRFSHNLCCTQVCWGQGVGLLKPYSVCRIPIHPRLETEHTTTRTL